jgi:hypothetical protein
MSMIYIAFFGIIPVQTLKILKIGMLILLT